MIPMNALNEMSLSQFTEQLGSIFEHSPWVAERAWEHRPFESREALYTRMVNVVQASSHEQKMNLIQAHPHLGTRKVMSSLSQKEQKNAGLGQLSEAEYAKLLEMNQTYVDRFGFPFILAVRGKSKDDILQSMQDRLKNTKEQELEQALLQIYQIARFRMDDQIE